MTKAELFEMLSHLPDDAEIRMQQPAHDYWRSQLAVDFSGVDEVKIDYSQYHNNDKIIEEGKEEDDIPLQTVYVLC